MFEIAEQIDWKVWTSNIECIIRKFHNLVQMDGGSITALKSLEFSGEGRENAASC